MEQSKRWPYLNHPAFSMRQVLAAWAVRDCWDVVEVGGGEHPVSGYLAPGQNYWGFELTEGNAVQEVRFEFPKAGGLVILGLDPEGPGAVERMVEWAGLAGIVVVEYAVGYGPAEEAWKRMEPEGRERWQLGLNFSALKTEKGFWLRRMQICF